MLTTCLVVWSHRAPGASSKPLHECVAVGYFQNSRGEKYGWSIHQSIMKSSVVMTWDIGDLCSKCNRCSCSLKKLAILGLQNVDIVHQGWQMQTTSYVALTASTSCKSRAICHIYHLINEFQCSTSGTWTMGAFPFSFIFNDTVIMQMFKSSLWCCPCLRVDNKIMPSAKDKDNTK